MKLLKLHELEKGKLYRCYCEHLDLDYHFRICNEGFLEYYDINTKRWLYVPGYLAYTICAFKEIQLGGTK